MEEEDEKRQTHDFPSLHIYNGRRGFDDLTWLAHPNNINLPVVQRRLMGAYATWGHMAVWAVAAGWQLSEHTDIFRHRRGNDQ